MHYQVADLNDPQLEPASADLIIGIMAVHHVENLEALFLKAAQALRHGGYFVMDESIGPMR